MYFIDLEKYEILNNKIPKYLREPVTGEITINGIKIVSEPDSSIKAWEHYINTYKKKLNMDNITLNLSSNRFISTILVVEEYVKLGGDCDFNFSDAKIHKSYNSFTCFNDLIEYSKAETEQKIRVIRKLELCRRNHHSLINFSLMPVTGGLNQVKQRIDKYDGLIKVLNKINDYYKSGEKVSKSKNNKLLHKHLDDIGSFDEYLNLYYFIGSEILFDYKPISKKCSNTNLNNLEMYLDNVMTYWVKKSEGLSN